jgi:hypothetical protein
MFLGKPMRLAYIKMEKSLKQKNLLECFARIFYLGQSLKKNVRGHDLEC